MKNLIKKIKDILIDKNADTIQTEKEIIKVADNFYNNFNGMI